MHITCNIQNIKVKSSTPVSCITFNSSYINWLFENVKWLSSHHQLSGSSYAHKEGGRLQANENNWGCQLVLGSFFYIRSQILLRSLLPYSIRLWDFRPWQDTDVDVDIPSGYDVLHNSVLRMIFMIVVAISGSILIICWLGHLHTFTWAHFFHHDSIYLLVRFHRPYTTFSAIW